MAGRALTAAALGAVVVLALVAGLAFPDADINYDLAWAIAWGDGLAEGDLPVYELDGAPTPHPLTTGTTMLASLVTGDGSAGVMHVLADLAYGGLVVATALLAASLFGWLAGLVAGGVVALSFPVVTTTTTAFQDVTTAMLIVLAVLLEVRKPRRGVAPLIALGAAGLLRPEAWGLAAAYWLAMWPGRTMAERVRLAALAAAAPVLWVLTDWIVTGEPLFSFTHTRSGAAAAKRTTGLADAPGQLADNLRGAVELVVLVGGLAGAAVALVLVWKRGFDRRVLVPLATLVLSTCAFLALGVSELSLLERYVLVPAALLAVFFGFAVTAWRHVEGRALVVAAALVAVVLAIGEARRVSGQVDRIDATFAYQRAEHDVLGSLRGLAADPRFAEISRRCDALGVDSYRVRPYLAVALDRGPETIVLTEPLDGLGGDVPDRGVLVVPATTRARDVVSLIGRTGGSLPLPPPGYREALRRGHWMALTKDC